jgi:hypothetical protein
VPINKVLRNQGRSSGLDFSYFSGLSTYTAPSTTCPACFLLHQIRILVRLRPLVSRVTIMSTLNAGDSFPADVTFMWAPYQADDEMTACGTPQQFNASKGTHTCPYFLAVSPEIVYALVRSAPLLSHFASQSSPTKKSSSLLSREPLHPPARRPISPGTWTGSPTSRPRAWIRWL